MDDATTPPDGPAQPAEPVQPPEPAESAESAEAPGLPEGSGAPPPPPPPPAGPPNDGTMAASMPERTGARWVKPLVIAAAALVIVAGLAIGAIAFVLRGSSDVITSMVP